ncbi:shikimate dehydrogenase [Sutcliffiella rhizosphaerae]|uniref:Shikimate dehydrogenase (NADP(+)) n=1 Tax=Sutcliffiella rhizosphaerae TaxID=2880967 RepID=A0ABM8YHN4_9BACI|nr:shikimate dehydrogenase [Sutcliffiella rhizosphaerae]CAG9619394.1 Shikimate dehydrogenase (NADP(+)) [Sutcliffiella rhizosphaerae]
MKKLYGVIGSPISQSMSPLIHNDAFSNIGIDAHYHAFHVEKNHLEQAVIGMKAIGVEGFNVTIPHKEAIFPLLDKVDQGALQIGAVNTVVKVADQFVGYNTDGSGFVQALKEVSAIQGKNILIVGAGGAARAILYSLALESNVTITVCNRTEAKAASLIEEFSLTDICISITVEQAIERLCEFDIVVQTTSVGMFPSTNETPLPDGKFKKGAIVSDIIYNPLKTKLLRDAENQGATIQHGVKMFVYQAALAFEHWTGQFPDTKRLEQLVEEKLGG